MLSIPLPYLWKGWNLLLTPQGGGLNPVLQIALYAAACLVPLVLVAWLYRYELQLVPRLAAFFLLSTRVVVLFLLLFLVLLQPVVAQSQTHELPSRVLVALDCSDSMDVADPQRPPVDKLRLVRALHLAGDVCTDAQLDAWIRDYQEKGSPQWLADDEARDDAQRRRELEEARRTQHDKVCDLADKMTRTQTARRILGDDGLRLVSALAARHDVELIGFHSEAWKVPADQPDALYNPPAADADKAPDAKPPDPTAPGAPPTSHPSSFTDLHLPLARALERSGAGAGKLLGVIVLTDGRHNAGDPPVKKAIELGEREVPIFPVVLGADLAPPDTAVLSVKAPPAVYKDAAAGVDVRFKVSGLQKQDVVLELHRGAGKEKKLLESRTIHHDGKDREYLESFQVKMDEAGPQTITATVHPADPSVKETSTDNNTGAAVVNVAKDQVRVLLIDGEARWEFHYLQSALQRDKTMQSQSVVFDQPRLNTALKDEDLDKIGSPWQHLPEGPDALADFDCIVLGDVSPAQLPPADRQRLEKYVAERGGTLIIEAGKRSMPLAYPDAGPGVAEADPLRKMLPIEAPRVAAPVDGFSPALTAEGRETKFMDLEEEAGKNEQRWADLPKHFWGVVGKLKPAAAALAFVPEGPADPTDPTAREKRNALIARQNYGLGRVLYVGMDSTWRWRKGVGDVYHHRFWGQVVRWAADRPLESGNQYVRFGTAQPVVHNGQDVELFVRFKDAKDAARAEARAEAHILRRGGDGKPVAVVPLSRRPAQPNAFEARIANLPEGDYEIQLEMPAVADKLQPTPGAPDEPKQAGPLKASFTVSPPDSAEMLDLSTNRPLLEELASKSHGKVYTPEDVEKLIDDLKSQTLSHTDYTEQKLWHWWAMLIAVVALLTVEWVVRKWSGLP